jgi:hypothetical protein
MTKHLRAKIGPRDIEILTSIDRCPLTPAQLRRLSETFELPFADEHNLRRRLRALAKADLIQSWPYAIAGDGRSPCYFKLTRQGFRLVYGESAAMPKRRYFESISPGHHHHTYCLAETIVHLVVTAKEHDCDVLHFARENSVQLVAEPFKVYPDCAFVIRRPDGKMYSFVIELDNGTERVRSKMDVESIERKLRGYDAHQAQFDAHDPDRYLVVFVTTRSELRVQNILGVAGRVMAQPKRCVFVGVELNRLLSADPFHVPVFADNRGLYRTVIPPLQFDNATKLQRQKTGSFAPPNVAQVVC